jgi:hypothetical protein
MALHAVTLDDIHAHSHYLFRWLNPRACSHEHGFIAVGIDCSNAPKCERQCGERERGVRLCGESMEKKRPDGSEGGTAVRYYFSPRLTLLSRSADLLSASGDTESRYSGLVDADMLLNPSSLSPKPSL